MKKLRLLAAMGCSSSASASIEWVPDKVVRLRVARSRVTLKHAFIRMVAIEAVTMPFKVEDGAVLTYVEVGDKVRFEVREGDRERVVHKIEVRR